MKNLTSNKWLFFVRFVIFFIVVYTIWHFSASITNKPFTFIGGNLIMLFDGRDLTKAVKAVDKLIVVVYEPSKDGKTLTMDYKSFTFNTVFLLALILAVPDIKHKLRFKILLLGMLILYPEQIFRMVIYVFNHYCNNMRLRSGAFIYPAYLHHAIGYIDRVLIRIDGQIVPIIIWASLFYYYKWHYIVKKMWESKMQLASGAK